MLVAVFVIGYFQRNSDLISDALSGFTPLALLSTVLVTAIGKVVLSIQCGAITTHMGHRFRARKVFWMYTASDVAKYVPGGIWNAVARVKLYADAGMSRSSSGRAFALEKYWQVLGALATGGIALAPNLHQSVFDSDPSAHILVVGVALAFVFWGLLAWFGANRISGTATSSQLIVRSIAEQCLMAVFLGLGLWIPLAAISSDVSAITAVGAFSIGRGIGYVAVFAPAGIGVREAVTLWALRGGIDVDLALIALGVNRVMTFAADVGSFGVGFGLQRWARLSAPTTEPTRPIGDEEHA